MKTVSPILLKSGIVLSAVLIYVVYAFSLLTLFDGTPILVSLLFFYTFYAIATALCFIGLPSLKNKPFLSFPMAFVISFLFPPAFIFFFSQTMFIRLRLTEPKRKDNETFRQKFLYFAGALGLAIPLYWPYDLTGFMNLEKLSRILYMSSILGLPTLFLASLVYSLLQKKITKSFAIMSGLFPGFLVGFIYKTILLARMIHQLMAHWEPFR